MIQIHIDKAMKAEIEKIFLNDAQTSPTGIFRVLRTKAAKNELMKHQKIYNALYEKQTGKLKDEEIKKLLLADRETLKEYINQFGAYQSKKFSDNLLKEVFKYDTYSKRNIVVEIMRKMNVTVCPYCNRQYIFTVKSGKTRPQLDHFYPKRIYPYLALSLYNMVPSCSICNQAKSFLDTVKEPVLYPYDEEFGYHARFELKVNGSKNFAKVLQGVSDEFSIELNTMQASNAETMKRQMNQLHLNELYQMHTDYVMNIIKLKRIHTPERIKEIYKSFPNIFRSYEDLKNVLYFTDMRKESWGKHPLSKLAYDIDQQLQKEQVTIKKVH